MSTNLTDTLLNCNMRFIGVKSQKGIFLSNFFKYLPPFIEKEKDS